MTRRSQYSILAADEPRRGRLWIYAREQRPRSGPEPPAAIYLFAPDRKAERPAAHLAAFKGILHVDGYAGFEQRADKEGITLAACWSYTRRRFYDVISTVTSTLFPVSRGRRAQ